MYHSVAPFLGYSVEPLPPSPGGLYKAAVGHRTFECEQVVDDLTQYLLTDDAQRAAFWQIHALGCCRRAVGRPLNDREYSELLNALSGQS